MSSSVGSATGPDNSPKTFLTPTKIVVMFVLIGVALAVWLTSCNSTDQKATTVNAQPSNSSLSVTPGPPPKPPVAGPVSLPSDIRDVQVKTLDGGSLKLSDYDVGSPGTELEFAL